MVGAGNPGQTQTVRNIVREKHKLSRSCNQIVSQLIVGAVIHAAVPFRADDFSIFITGQSAVGVGGSAFPGQGHKLGIGDGKGYRHIVAGQTGDGCHGVSSRRDSPAKGRAGGVLYNTDFFRGKSGGFGNVPNIGVDLHCFTVDGQQTVVAPVSLNRVALNGHMRFSGRIKRAFHHIRRLVDKLRRIVARSLYIGLLGPHIGVIFMDSLSVRHSCLQIGAIFRQLLPVDGDFFRRFLSVSLGIGDYQGYNISIVENFVLHKDGVRLAAGQSSRRKLHESQAVWSLDVRGSHDFVHTGHLFRFFFMNGL